MDAVLVLRLSVTGKNDSLRRHLHEPDLTRRDRKSLMIGNIQPAISEGNELMFTHKTAFLAGRHERKMDSQH